MRSLLSHRCQPTGPAELVSNRAFSACYPFCRARKALLRQRGYSTSDCSRVIGTTANTHNCDLRNLPMCYHSSAGATHGRFFIQILPVCSVMLKTNLSIATDIPMKTGSPIVISERRDVWKWRTGNAAPDGCFVAGSSRCAQMQRNPSRSERK